jgi:hypothetical protein
VAKMPISFIIPPKLPYWVQQLAGILPLTALIEFIDLPTKLHTSELTGSVLLWDWPVTPAGARLLLRTLDNGDACCLDHEDRGSVLHCIDGRHGDCYPSSAPTTTRLAVSSQEDAFIVLNNSPNMLEESIRKQTLKVVLLSHKAESIRNSSDRARKTFLGRFRGQSIRYRLVAYAGWILWAGILSISIICRLYLSGTYLVLILLTGVVIRVTHGGIPRRLLDNNVSQFNRMVVATSSFNSTDWSLFYGGSRTVNSLLNKPLLRRSAAPRSPALHFLLQALIVSQWVVAVGTCALQDWNAILVSIWLFVCAVTTAYLVPPKSTVLNWLARDCNIIVTRIGAEFSSRRSMLSAMVYLNPDSQESRTSWIDPILAPCADRSEWEDALLDFINHGKCSISHSKG